MTPEEITQLFAELRQTVAGTRVKFHLQETATTIEGIVVDPPGTRPPGLEDGIFLQDVEDQTQIYCLCEDPPVNGEGNLRVHTFNQGGGDGTVRIPSLILHDDISRDLLQAEGVTAGGGITQELHRHIEGVVDTEAPPPAPLVRDATLRA